MSLARSRFKKLLTTLCAVPVLIVAASATAAAAPAPHDKSQSPPTDLMHYPKRHDVPGSGPAVVPTVGPAAASRVVQVVKPQLMGGVDVTVYTPAPGVSPDALAASLRDKGVNGVQVITESASRVPAGQVTPAYSSGACAYGTARTLGCPPIHWANNGYAHPQVYFNDHTGSQWPVDQVVYTWNQANGIDSGYKFKSCGPAGTHCVNVYDLNYGRQDWAGLTHYQADGNGNFIDWSVYVELNDYFYYNADGLRQVPCHELGHALGLDHNVQSYSCMWFQIENNGHRLPDSDDFNMLASIYSVRH